MAKKEEEKKNAETKGVSEEIISKNLIGNKAVDDALAEITKEKDERKKTEAKRALCIGTYYNQKTRLQLQQRRREDDITKEKLEASKALLERLIGFKTEIKDGSLVPTKDKIDEKDRLTPVQFEKETRTLDEETRKKFSESNKTFEEAVRELRDSYEGQYRYYLNEW